MKGHTKESSLAAWRKILDASLNAEATVTEIAKVVGLSRPAVAQYLRRNVPNDGWRWSIRSGRSVRMYQIGAVRTAVRAAQGPGNHTTGPERSAAAVSGWDTRLSRKEET